MSFTNQVVIITGASSGIGWALAQELARQGAKVGLVARRRDKLEQLAESTRQTGGTVAFAVADVTDRAGTKSAIAALRQELGPVDLLIANAGYGKPTRLDQSNIEQVEQMFKINVMGVIFSIEAVLPEMLQHRRGHIVAMSSLAGYKAFPGESGYCASKAAVITYMDGLRIQLQPHGIAVTTICPGFIRTPMTEGHKFKMPFLLEADEAARRITRALRRRVKLYAFPWQMAFLMRMTRWLPDWLIRRVVGPYTSARESLSEQAEATPESASAGK